MHFILCCNLQYVHSNVFGLGYVSLYRSEVHFENYDSGMTGTLVLRDKTARDNELYTSR